MDNLCRVCMEDDASEELFSISDSSLRYYQMVTACTGISIIKNDGLPQRICVTCVCDITHLYKFRSKCLKTDTLLRKILEDDNTNKLEELKQLPIHVTNENSKEYPDETNDNSVNRMQTRPKKVGNYSERPKRLLKKNRQSVSQSSKVLQDDIQSDDNDDMADCSSSDFEPSHFASDEECVSKDLDIPKKTKRPPITFAFSCRKCELNFLSWKELEDHNSKHVATTEEESLSCRYCGFKFSFQGNMLPHFNQEHSEIQRFQCGYCGEKFKEFKQLRRHLTAHRPGDTVINIAVPKEEDNKTEEFNNYEGKTTLRRELRIRLEVLKLSDHFKTEENYPPSIKTDTLESDNVASEGNDNLLGCKEETYDDTDNLYICYMCEQHFTDKETLESHFMEEHKTDNINSSNNRSGEENSTSFEKSVTIDNEESAVAEVQNESNMAAVSNSPITVLASDSPKTINKRETSKSHDLGEPPLKKPKKKKSLLKEVHNESSMAAVSNRPITVHASNLQHNSPKTITLPIKITVKKNYLALKEDALHCSICGKRFKFKSEVKRHQTSHDPDKPYHCMRGRCRWSFGTETELAIHMKVNHPEDGQYHCDICQKNFKHPKSLRDHMLQHGPAKQYICTYCNKVFTNAEYYKIHLRLHTKELPFLCQTCGAAFATKDRLKNHSWRHTAVRAFSCDQCKSSFKTAPELKDHKKVHTGERPHLCPVCGNSYTRLSIVKKHVKKMHKDTILETVIRKCDICGNLIPVSELDQHMKIHTTRYSCILCSITYSLASELEAHNKTHSMEDRSHVCGKCGSSFDQAGHLRGHMAKCYVVGDISLPCPHCPKKYISKYLLASHIKTHTGEKKGL